MNREISSNVLLALFWLIAAGCGNYPAPIRSARDIKGTPASEDMVLIVNLSREDWPKLQKFRGLEHFNIAKEMAPQITDGHLIALSHLKLPRLRQVSVADCSNVTDGGLQALTNLPSIEGFQLIRTSITDRGLQILAAGFPKLTGFNVEGCNLLTEDGFLCLTNSKTITDIDLSLAPLGQARLEHIISSVTNVTWWTISDPHHMLNEAPLGALAESRKINIQIVDENNLVRSVSPAQKDADGREPPTSKVN
jgi:hypothetical protein